MRYCRLLRQLFSDRTRRVFSTRSRLLKMCIRWKSCKKTRHRERLPSRRDASAVCRQHGHRQLRNAVRSRAQDARVLPDHGTAACSLRTGQDFHRRAAVPSARVPSTSISRASRLLARRSASATASLRRLLRKDSRARRSISTSRASARRRTSSWRLPWQKARPSLRTPHRSRRSR